MPMWFIRHVRTAYNEKKPCKLQMCLGTMMDSHSVNLDYVVVRGPDGVGSTTGPR